MQCWLLNLKVTNGHSVISHDALDMARVYGKDVVLATLEVTNGHSVISRDALDIARVYGKE